MTAETMDVAPKFDPIAYATQREWTEKEREELLASLCRFASKDDARSNIACVHFEASCAVATNGHALLVVRDLVSDLRDGSLSVRGGKLTPWIPMYNNKERASPFPDWRQILWKPEAYKQSFLIDRFAALRKIRADIMVSIFPDGLRFAAHGGLATLNMRYLANLPATDDAITLSIIDDKSGILVRPVNGGWFAVAMPVRTGPGEATAKPCAFLAVQS